MLHRPKARIHTRGKEAGGSLRPVVLLLASLLLCSLGVQAQSPVNLEKLDAYIAAAQKEWNVPGLAVAIVKDGEVVLAKGYGVRELGKPAKVDKHTVFAIASNTKAFVAASLARLVDEGKLKWDDRVTDHLPYFQLYSNYATREMRIRDLLSHRSGLGTFSGDLIWYGTNYSAEEVIRRVRFLPPASSFREKYGYSNLMFITAGEVVPAVTGKRWPDYVREEFFQPLGMTDSVLSIRDLAAKTNVATPHGERRGELVAYEWAGWDNSAAAGGIVSSVSDMSKWIRLQLGRGTVDGRTYFSEKSSRTMWTQHTSQAVSKESEKLIPSTHFRGYGLGWGLMDYRGRKIVSHGGGYDGMFSRVALAPEENLGVVILTNSMTSLPVALTYRILDAYLGGDERDWSQVYLERAEKARKKKGERWAKRERARVASTKQSLPLESYTGTYGGPMYGDATVTAEDGKLVLRLLPNPDFVADLTHWHFDTFEVDWRKEFSWFDKGHVQFILNHQGQVVEMKIDVPNDDFWFTELEFKKKKEK